MKSLTSIDEILHNQAEIRNTAQAFFDENTVFQIADVLEAQANFDQTPKRVKG